jgi:L-lactate dehydrogenase complex protein LldG
MSRDTFLARVRAAAEAGRAFRVAQGSFPADAGYQGAGPDPVARFVAELTAVGGRGHVAADRADAREVLGRLLDEHGARSALCWEHAALDRLGLPELLAARGIDVWTHARLAPLPLEEQRAAILAADIGITGVTWAVAETGTIALASGPGTERLASLAPPVHVAVVERDQLLPDLFDMFARYADEGSRLPSNLALVTGPSKTGDIELKLTTGVHGPGVWHVVVVA